MDLKGIAINYAKDVLTKKIKGSTHKEIRSRNSKILLYILIGYKDFIWDNFFARLMKFVPDNIDVCLVSSGKKISTLSQKAEEHNWSYIYSLKNNVSILQNLVIDSFPKAEYIYKMDEDILLTENIFESLMATYEVAEKDNKYHPAFVGPLINVNGYSYSIILDSIHKKDAFIDKFGSAKIESGPDKLIEEDVNTALFMWGVGGYVPNIDRLNNSFSKKKTHYSICPIRYSIGLILFKRTTWEEMGGFPRRPGNGMGIDEEKIDSLAIKSAKVAVIDENAVVGHAGFGKQTDEFKKFVISNPTFLPQVK
ncbi:hypothetical protein ACKP2L_07160 [Oenococcus alcoholitolerans]|uniref:Glycosyltransferase 2-like domain-containing protein n=1 Tax=Oenococcus alcoholitolerans TaxID=931074 RepID=A0ABR4XQW0_9LACO|nr:hypothetical protein Q757_04610 [Oenococcus alcoholitolerans]